MGVRRAVRMLMCMVLAVAAGVVAPPVAAAVPAWSIVPSANPPGPRSGLLASVACASATSCFTVGDFTSGRWNDTDIAHWNGATWSVQSSPNVSVPADGGSYLDGVACASTSMCFAVGFSESNGVDKPLIEQWNGVSWTTVASANPFGSQFTDLFAVTCASTTECFAVGSYKRSSTDKTLIERWNGTSWSIVSSPNVAGAQTSTLLGVACASANVCFAAGGAANGITPRTLVERWNGSTWSIVASPTPTGSDSPNLRSVSCPTVSSCFAAGDSQASSTVTPLVEHWGGTGWSIMTTPKVSGTVDDGFRGVSCATGTQCVAVGELVRSVDGTVATLVESWNGTAWAIATSPNPDPKDSDLLGVACSSTTLCFAVGVTGMVTVPTIVEQWNGTAWSLAAHPDNAPSISTLAGVSCAVSTACFAVGSHATVSNATAPLIESPAGSTWSQVTSPKPTGAQNASLSAVSCPSSVSCFAVGKWNGTTGPQKTLIEHWNGTSWSVVTSPNPAGNTAPELSDVSCASTTSCFAVGVYDNGRQRTLVERFNGSAWSILATPNFSTTTDSRLAAVSCPAVTLCFAVGAYTSEPVTYSRTLVERWNGSSWAIMTSPHPNTFSELTDVSCATGASCNAVGDAYASPSTVHSLIEHWNGSTWATVTSSDRAAAAHTVLSGISCPSTTACVAVGADDAGAPNATLVKTLSGTTWTIASSPNPAGATDSNLHAVSCASASSCISAGDYDRLSAPLTLVEQYA